MTMIRLLHIKISSTKKLLKETLLKIKLLKKINLQKGPYHKISTNSLCFKNIQNKTIINYHVHKIIKILS